MGWASGFIEQLRRGDTVAFRPRGHSMSPKIESGQLCTVAPGRFQIGNNRGFINGWIGAGAIYGRLLRVEP